MKRLTIAEAIGASFIALVLAAGAIAGPSTYKTKLTFSQPVRVPGATLPAGTYYFQAPQMNNRTLIRITDESGKFVVQFMGLPERTRKRVHDIVTFGAQECKPTAIKLWFYPSTDVGVRFVYPEDEAASIAASCNEAVPETHEAATDVSHLQGEKVYLVTSKGQEEEFKSDALSASDQADQNGFDGESDPQQRF